MGLKPSLEAMRDLVEAQSAHTRTGAAVTHETYDLLHAILDSLDDFQRRINALEATIRPQQGNNDDR